MKIKIKWVYVLFGLSCFSLIGIIGAQAYWVNQLFIANKQSLDDMIRKVLQKSTKKIQTIEYNNYYKNIEETISSIKKSAQREVDLKALIKDPNTNTTYLYTQKYFLEDTYLPIPNLKDTLSLTNLLTDNKSIKISKSDSIKIKPISASINSNLSDNSFAFDQYLKIRGKHIPIENRIKLSQIDSIIKTDLELEGINAEYNFSILKKDSTQIYPKINSVNKNKSAYILPLFLDEKDKPTHLLSVSLIGKDRYLFQKIGSALILSILFTLFIWAVFFSFFIYIRRQRKLSEMKTDFLNNMTHEFKTPIATIAVAAEALKNEKIIGDETKIKHYSYLIKQENKRMLSQIEMVLGMAHLEKEQAQQIHLEPQDINNYVKQAVESLKLIIESRNGILSENYHNGPLESMIDKTHFLNVIINILDNANKYSPKNPINKITTQKEENYNNIVIEDQGIGIAKKNIKHIFEPFYREYKGNVHDVKGHGLGLAYVKNIIDLHKGIISVKSDRDKGSTFTIKIPKK